MGVVRYYSIDVVTFYAITLLVLVYGLKKLCWRTISRQVTIKKKLD